MKKIIQLFPDTQGLLNDATIIASIVKDRAAVFSCKWGFDIRSLPLTTNEDTKDSDLVISYEHLTEYPLEGNHGDQWLMVNPDYFDDIDHNNVKRLTGMLHKSEYSYNMFKQSYKDLKHVYLGWTSTDAYKDHINKDYSKVYAQFGAALRRQPQLISELLITNPEFPQTTITQYDERGIIGFPFPMAYRTPKGKNIHYILIGRLEFDVMTDLMNQNGIHLCLGMAEGFGHYINEGRSSKAVIFAMDAPPMNELINEDNGILVKPSESINPRDIGQQGAVSLVKANADTFYNAFNKLENMSIKDREEVGEQARCDFLKGREEFYKNTEAFFEKVLK
jgi:hypothetical protein